ncbi:MAG: glycosyltransferase family 4 protein [Endomicrobium sp.]|jgi:glycosyltransferase involved in cell wall biosynthesis|nr:glycosyltransferase family 4 protein [Endomicrobium sp.]
MKILYDYQLFCSQKFGGASQYFYELIRNSTGLFECELSGKYSENIYAQELNFHKSFPIPFSFKGKWRLMNYLNKMDTVKKIKKEKIDIIHPTLYDPYIFRYRNIPVITTIHDMIYEKFPNYFPDAERMIQYKKESIKKANRINVNSEATRTDVLKYYPETEEKITVVYHAFSNNFFSYEEKKENYILFTGIRGGYKNFDRFVLAVAPILLKYDLQLICTGKEFDKTEISLLESENIIDRTICKFASEKELIELYAKALIFVFPSLYEGFGIPILEAFAAGCPALLSNQSSLPEIGGEAAVYFDPSSIEEMRSKMEKVITSPELQKELIKKGREQVKKFSWGKCTQNTMAVYKSLL